MHVTDHAAVDGALLNACVHGCRGMPTCGRMSCDPLVPKSILVFVSLTAARVRAG